MNLAVLQTCTRTRLLFDQVGIGLSQKTVDETTMAQVARLCREAKEELGPDAPRRLRILLDMVLIEADRPLRPPGRLPLARANEPLVEQPLPDHEP